MWALIKANFASGYRNVYLNNNNNVWYTPWSKTNTELLHLEVLDYEVVILKNSFHSVEFKQKLMLFSFIQQRQTLFVLF